MKLSEFAESRGVDAKAVSAYLKRHAEKAKKEKDSAGASLFTYKPQVGLTDKQIELLDKKYPLPKPVEVVRDLETLEKYNKALERIALLEKEKGELTSKAARLELIENHNKTLTDANEQQAEHIAEQEHQIMKLEHDAEKAKEDYEALKQEVERLKGRSLWQRILNK